MPSINDVELLWFCDYDRFTLLLGAELAFDWNADSHLIRLRLLNAKPAFLFGKGQLARGVKMIDERIIDCDYQDREAIYLDPMAPVLLYGRLELSTQRREQSRQITEDLQRSPTPDKVFHELFQ